MDEAARLAASDTIADMVRHPAFAGFGEHLVPRPQDAQSGLPLREVGRLMHTSKANPGKTVSRQNKEMHSAWSGAFFAQNS